MGLILFGHSHNVAAQVPRTARVIAEKVSLRETPSAVGHVEGDVSEGTTVRVLDEKLPWYVVRVGDRVGWIHGATLLFLSEAYAAADQQKPIQSTTLPSAVLSAPSSASTEAPPAQTNRESGVYTRGPRGGCYRISGTARKVYVDRSLCN